MPNTNVLPPGGLHSRGSQDKESSC